MAWQFPQSTTAPGVIVSLGAADDAFIASGVTIASTNTVTVFGSGSNHEVLIYGTVASNVSAVQLGTLATDSGNAVTVKAGAHVQIVGAGGARGSLSLESTRSL